MLSFSADMRATGAATRRGEPSRMLSAKMRIRRPPSSSVTSKLPKKCRSLARRSFTLWM